MKLIKIIVFGLLVMTSPTIVKAEEATKAPPSIVLNYLEYCQGIQIENDSEHETNLLNCVNTELEGDGFTPFASYTALIAYVETGED
jgi:hypothetical protein